MAQYFPIFLNLKQQPCLVIGAGAVAVSKVASLVKAGAVVTVVAPEALTDIRAWHQERRIQWKRRRFRKTDLDGALLTIAATGDIALNHRIHGLATKQHKLVNAVDDSEHCNFIFAAVAEAGPLRVAVSSSGTSPTLAGRLRDRIQRDLLRGETALLAEYLGMWRPKAKKHLNSLTDMKRFWRRVLDSEIPRLLAARQPEEADRLMQNLIDDIPTHGSKRN